MLIWLVLVTWHYERFSLGKTGRERATCQLALMCRTSKPKRYVCKDMASCGGVQTQAPVIYPGVTDYEEPFLPRLSSEGEMCGFIERRRENHEARHQRHLQVGSGDLFRSRDELRHALAASTRAGVSQFRRCHLD